ncbi:hypothetical protein ACP70R_047106 [Stipagrostis hirtigluma subsp. patula]
MEGDHFCPIVSAAEAAANRAKRMKRNKDRALMRQGYAPQHAFQQPIVSLPRDYVTLLKETYKGMAYALLKDVNPDSQRWRVKVRVVRFSEFHNKEQPPKLQRIDFIMLDEKNKSMECNIPQRWIDTHRARLVEDHVYFIHYFEVLNARSTYRPVEHEYMARFTKHTEITEVIAVPPDFPLYACTIRSFAELSDKADKREYLLDAIGVLQKCGHTVMQSTKSTTKPLRNIHITDGNEMAVVSLWGDHANNFDAERYTAMSAQGPVVLLFAGVTSGYFKGRLTLQASPTCRWYANPLLPETAMLRDKLAKTAAPVEWIGAPPDQVHGANKTVAELAQYDNPHEVWGNTYTVVAKIRNLKANNPWWYMGCTYCKKRADPYGDAYKCTNPKCSNTSALPRYRITFFVTDPEPPAEGEPPAIEFICFGPTGDELTGVSVDVLVAATGSDHTAIPEHITRLYGRVYEFGVSVGGGSLQNENTTFRVDSVRNAIVPAEQAAAMHPLGVEAVLPVAQAQEDNPPDPIAQEAAQSSTPVKDIIDSPHRELLPPRSGTLKIRDPRDTAQGDEALEDADASDETGGLRGSKRLKKHRPGKKLHLDLSDDDG